MGAGNVGKMWRCLNFIKLLLKSSKAAWIDVFGTCLTKLSEDLTSMCTIH